MKYISRTSMVIKRCRFHNVKGANKFTCLHNCLHKYAHALHLKYGISEIIFIIRCHPSVIRRDITTFSWRYIISANTVSINKYNWNDFPCWIFTLDICLTAHSFWLSEFEYFKKLKMAHYWKGKHYGHLKNILTCINKRN